MVNRWTWAVAILGLLGQGWAQEPLPPGPLESAGPPGAFGAPPAVPPEFCPVPGGFPGLGPIRAPLPCNGFSEGNPCPPLTAFEGGPGCDPCGFARPCFWFAAEQVNWFQRRSPLAVQLATTSLTPDVTNNVGAIGQSGTSVLAGLSGAGNRGPDGARIVLGFAGTCDWRCGVEVVYNYMHDATSVLNIQSNAAGSPLLARPILSTDPTGAGETVFLSSFPGLASGAIKVDSSFQINSVQGRSIIACGLEYGDESQGGFLDVLIGGRYVNMRETINIGSTSTPINPGFAVFFLGTPFGPGNQTIVTDVFRTHNEFRGAEFGLRFECRKSCVFLSLEPKVGIGFTRQDLNVEGASFLVSNTGASNVAGGGLLAVASNGGNFDRERFTVMPEGTLNIGWDICSNIRLQAGYTILYWPNVLRPGSHVSRAVDLRQVPTDLTFGNAATFNAPTPNLIDSGLLLHGVSFGVVFNF